MVRRHSHSGSSSGSGIDWFTDKLTPAYLKKKRAQRFTRKELPAVEPETPEQAAERTKEPDAAIHATLMERYNRRDNEQVDA